MGVLRRSRWGKHWESTSKSSCKSTYKSSCKSTCNIQNAPPQEAGLPSGHPSPGLTGQSCSGPGGLRQLHPEPLQTDYETAEQPPPSDQLWSPRHFPLWPPNKCSVQGGGKGQTLS